MSNASIPEHFFRHEYGRLVAILAHRVGIRHLEAVEDAVQSALAKALENWTRGPLPENPSGWLYRVAANRLTGELRQHSRRLRILKRVSHPSLTSGSDLREPMSQNEITDDLLRMLFFCCDGGMPIQSQLVIALKTLCGFDVREIAQRLFTTEENVYKRLKRARNHLKSKKRGPYEWTQAELDQRLPAVHQVLYLLFSEGYLSTSGGASVKTDLCSEGMRLAGLLAHSSFGSTPETAALLALMHFHSARTSARVDGSGGLILLEDQDRNLWDRGHIQSGLVWLELSARGTRYSRYHAEAAIAAEHCLAPSFAETNWTKIVRCYDLLIVRTPSAVMELNRAVALAEVIGPSEALSALDRMKAPVWLTESYLWSAVLADLHFRNASREIAQLQAATAYQRAPSAAIRELLQRRFERYLSVGKSGCNELGPIVDQ